MKKILIIIVVACLSIGSSFKSDTIADLKATTGNVGIGITTPDGKVHIQEGTAGSVTASSSNTLVVESSADTGTSILSPDVNTGRVVFGSPSDPFGASMGWNFAASDMFIGPSKLGAQLRLLSGLETLNLTLSGNAGSELATFKKDATINGQIKIIGGNPQNSRYLRSDADGLASWGDVGWTDLGNDVVLLNSGDDVGIGTGTPNAKLDVTGSSGTIIGGFASGALHVTDPSTAINANAVITGHNSNSGNKQLWYFGSVSSSNDNIAFINRQDASMSFSTNNTTRLSISNTGTVTVTNFTKLGSDAPVIKMKRVTGTGGTSEGWTTNIAHGLTLSKIVGVTILLTAPNANKIPPSFTSVGEFQYDYFLTDTNIVVDASAANSGSILSSSAIVAVITHEE